MEICDAESQYVAVMICDISQEKIQMIPVVSSCLWEEKAQQKAKTYHYQLFKVCYHTNSTVQK